MIIPKTKPIIPPKTLSRVPCSKNIFLKSLISTPRLKSVLRLPFLSRIIIISAPIKLKRATTITSVNIKYTAIFSVFNILYKDSLSCALFLMVILFLNMLFSSAIIAFSLAPAFSFISIPEI